MYAELFTEHEPGGVSRTSGAGEGRRIDHVALKGRCGAKISEVISGAGVDAVSGEDVSPPFLLIFNFQVNCFFFLLSTIRSFLPSCFVVQYCIYHAVAYTACFVVLIFLCDVTTVDDQK